MPEYLAPGVYVEEVSSGNKPIAGVSTSTAGFVGGAEKGPLTPQFISSWAEFQRVYGTYVPDQSFLAYAVEGFFNNGGVRCFVCRVVGEEGAPLTAADFRGQPAQEAAGPDDSVQATGLAALEAIDEISILCVPDEVHPNVENGDQITTAVINQCEKLTDRFAVVSCKQGQTDVTNLRPPHDTNYGAFYYPWIKINDSSINSNRIVPPSGHVAGIYARVDTEQGVHKAPANEVVRGAVDLEFPVTKAKQDILNPRGVNCFRDFRGDGRGIRLWGARTMSSNPEWRYVNVRRLFLFVEESIDEGTKWVVFEPNDESTWASVRRNLTSFLLGVWRSGALMGTTSDEAFFVSCDRTTMTQDDIDNGRLVAVIGIAPVKPAEFVIFRISQKTAA